MVHLQCSAANVAKSFQPAQTYDPSLTSSYKQLVHRSVRHDRQHPERNNAPGRATPSLEDNRMMTQSTIWGTMTGQVGAPPCSSIMLLTTRTTSVLTGVECPNRARTHGLARSDRRRCKELFMCSGSLCGIFGLRHDGQPLRNRKTSQPLPSNEAICPGSSLRINNHRRTNR